MPDLAEESAAVTHRRPKCFFDVSHAGGISGRLVFELFDDIVPKTAENFSFDTPSRQICIGEHTGKDGKKLHYKGSYFHRVVADFMIQGGDITKHNGTGGMSIYGRDFADEGFTLNHTTQGLLSMANAGRNTNNSQFFVTVKATPWLDNKHVIFGRVLEGMDTVLALNRVKVNGDKPAQQIVVRNCGELLDEVQAEERRRELERKAQEERDAAKSEIEKSHERVRAARAKIEQEATQVIDEVSSAVAEGIKRERKGAGDGEKERKRPKKMGMLADLEGDDEEEDEDEDEDEEDAFRRPGGK